jgi:DNA-binding FadR family transcriptional regulator
VALIAPPVRARRAGLGRLALPSITELSALQGIGTGVIRHALETLTADGLIIARHGRAAPEPEAARAPATTAAAPGAGRMSVTR